MKDRAPVQPRLALSRLGSYIALSFVVLSTPPFQFVRQLGIGGTSSGNEGQAPIGGVMAVDKKKFRKCADTGFCRRNRDRTASTPASPVSVFSIDRRGVSCYTVVATHHRSRVLFLGLKQVDESPPRSLPGVSRRPHKSPTSILLAASHFRDPTVLALVKIVFLWMYKVARREPLRYEYCFQAFRLSVIPPRSHHFACSSS